MRNSLVFVVAAALAGCGNHATTCNPMSAQSGCSNGQLCEMVQNGMPTCFAPVLVRGTVSDPTLMPAKQLDDAHVVALDPSRAPLSTVAVSANGGAYELKVHATRDANGKPLQALITLRADKQGYQPFPGGVRPALPIDLSTATLMN